jgi:DNA-binding transcriptional MerR regulator/effector-binding domain-containing protein
MLRIGEFARISQIPAKTLRYYDEIGLLKPAHCDPETGYRYYAANQMEQLQRILALKDMGLSLEQVLFVQEERLSAEQMQAMLKAKRMELQRKIQECKAQVMRVETWLQQFEARDTISPSTVTLKSVAAYRVASIRERVTTPDELRWIIGRLSSTLEQYLKTQQTSIVGPSLHLYHAESLVDEECEIEVAYQVDGDPVSDGRIQVYDLPAVETMASLLHIGEPHILFHAHYTLEHWIETNSYRVIGPKREIYHYYRSSQEMNMYLAELQYPVELISV